MASLLPVQGHRGFVRTAEPIPLVTLCHDERSAVNGFVARVAGPARRRMPAGGGCNLHPPRGPSMALTAISFDSAGSAETHQELTLQSVQGAGNIMSPESQFAEGVLGDESYLLTADADGIGSVVGFLLGPYVVQLHTTFPEGAALLVSPQDLGALAETVRAGLVSPR